jgi:predicted ATPase
MYMVNNTAENFFVITGGPGSGKSSLIEALGKRGYACSVEDISFEIPRASVEDRADFVLDYQHLKASS